METSIPQIKDHTLLRLIRGVRSCQVRCPTTSLVQTYNFISSFRSQALPLAPRWYRPLLLLALAHYQRGLFLGARKSIDHYLHLSSSPIIYRQVLTFHSSSPSLWRLGKNMLEKRGDEHLLLPLAISMRTDTLYRVMEGKTDQSVYLDLVDTILDAAPASCDINFILDWTVGMFHHKDADRIQSEILLSELLKRGCDINGFGSKQTPPLQKACLYMSNTHLSGLCFSEAEIPDIQKNAQRVISLLLLHGARWEDILPSAPPLAQKIILSHPAVRRTRLRSQVSGRDLETVSAPLL